jgi:nondiscriminating glutamyl-tRNA synthetase
MTVRVRFAPSPTGLLHVGNARTAIFNYLFARQNQGTLVLRIEDTDTERSTDASMATILEDLRWLGIRWEEGPDIDGPLGPYRQSHRLDLYRGYINQLYRQGRVYKCYCSPERLEALRKDQLSRGHMPRYDGRCLSLSNEETLRMGAEGIQPVLRFQVGKGAIPFEDIVYGGMNFDRQGIGDFIIVRSGGMPAYNFACVIDDHSMEITHVIRGEDHLSNTPRQILLYDALGWAPPTFAHHPLILGPDRSPLSKRHGATAVSQYREEGFLPEALLNYLVLLGWTSPSGEEVLSMERILQDFSLSDISRSAPVYTRKKLEWLNASYLRNKTDSQLAEMLLPYLEQAGIRMNSTDRDRFIRISGTLKGNLVTLSEVRDYLGIFFDEAFSYEEKTKEILTCPEGRETLRQILGILDGFSEDLWEDWPSFLSRLEQETGLKGKKLFAPLRAGMTGKIKGPQLADILSLIGKERTIKRLKMALEIN